MFTTLVTLLAACLALNLAVVVLGRRLAGRRGEHRQIMRRSGERRLAASVDGYGATLLLRVLVQARRVAGARQACLFLSDPSREGALVPVVSHGLDEGVLGRRIDIGDGAWGIELVAADGTRISAGSGVVIPVVRTTIGECGYLWAAAGPAGALGDRQVRLLTELTELCAQALDDVDRAARLDEAIGRALTLLTEHDDRAAAGRHAALATAVGGRLGMDAAALVELDVAARVHHAVPAAPAAAVRALPGFESVAIVLRFVSERWDGNGPNRLRGDRIPLGSRVLDACAALEDDVDRSLRAIQGESGSRFDPSVVAALSHELLGPVPGLEGAFPTWADGDRMFAGLPAG